MQSIFPIVTPQEVCKKKPHNKLGVGKSLQFQLVGYSDSDWAKDTNDRKNTTGLVFYMGDTTFTWISKKQPIVTLSTCEAEYVVITSNVCHAI